MVTVSWKILYVAGCAFWVVGLVRGLVDDQLWLAVGSAVLFAATVFAGGLRWYLTVGGHPRPAAPPDLAVEPVSQTVNLSGGGPEATILIRRRRSGVNSRARRINVLCDGRVVARLWNGQSARLHVLPGQHEIQASLNKGYQTEKAHRQLVAGQEMTAEIVLGDLSSMTAAHDRGLSGAEAAEAVPIKLVIADNTQPGPVH